MIALIYHDVVPRQDQDQAGFPGPVAGAYKLEPARFAAHLEAIAAAGVRPGTLSSPGGALLTFDDGGASSLAIAAELERHGWRGVFFVVSARVGTRGFLDEAGVRELAARGHDVGSHSATHPAYMGRLERAELAREWTVSRERLGELLGEPPRSAAVPGGSVSQAVIEEVARAGYAELFTSTPAARTARHGTLAVRGRYTIWASDTPQLAAALAAGARVPRTRRWLAWQLKSGAKRVSPRVYEAARSVRAGRRSSPARNDSNRAV